MTVRFQIAASVTTLLMTVAFSDTLAKPHSGKSGDSSSPPSSGGSPPRAGTNSSGSQTHYTPRISFGENPYKPYMHVYRSVPIYVNGSKTLTYPAVHGSMSAIHPKLNASNHVKSHVVSRTNTTLKGVDHHGSPGKTFATTTHVNRATNNVHTRSRLDPQTAHQLKNWNGKKNSLAEAQRNNREFHRNHHDRAWWRHHCAAIIFFDFGWWGWWDGWWYPAWGYDPYYSYYAYDQPIYDYDGLAPDQVVANVQSALQQHGYFSYATDGQMGPLTRAAIANYQRDHMLPITGNIDPATLASLGLTD